MAKNDTVAAATPVELTIALLQEENTGLKEQITGLSDDISILKVQNIGLQEENDLLKVQLEALELAVIEKDAALEIARKSEQSSSVKIDTAKPTAPSVPIETFTVEGKTYRFKKAGFIIGENRYKAVEALQNDAILVKLIDYPSVVEEVG